MADTNAARTDLDLTVALRSAAANLLRVVGGGGKPYNFIDQFLEIAKAESAYCDAHGHAPLEHVYHHALNPLEALFDARPDLRATENLNLRLHFMHERDVLRYSARWAAALLIHQPTHRSTAESDFWRSVKDLREHQKWAPI